MGLFVISLFNILISLPLYPLGNEQSSFLNFYLFLLFNLFFFFFTVQTSSLSEEGGQIAFGYSLDLNTALTSENQVIIAVFLDNKEPAKATEV